MFLFLILIGLSACSETTEKTVTETERPSLESEEKEETDIYAILNDDSKESIVIKGSYGDIDAYPITISGSGEADAKEYLDLTYAYLKENGDDSLICSLLKVSPSGHFETSQRESEE